MKRLLAFANVLAVVALLRLQGGASPIYENFGTLTNVPQIDAVAFANYGTFVVPSVLPFDTQNTLYFTNRGVMLGGPGFRLDYVNDAGIRRPAANVFNANGAGITADFSPLSLELPQ